MDYKEIIPSQDLRLKILKFTEFLPDKLMIKIQYWIKTGRMLDLENPERYTEKLQWYKLFYRDPKMIQCADKFTVRKFIKEKGLEQILIPLYGAYQNVEDINFEKLPKKFVMKTSNGSGTNLFCNDKDYLDIHDTTITLKKWLEKRTSKAGREWAYYDVSPMITCEMYLEKDSNNDLVDYKFYCFNGEISHIKIVKERFSKEGPLKGFFDINLEQLPYFENDSNHTFFEVGEPTNYNTMLEIVKKLSEDFPHVRVDLYNIDGKIYFGELTFYDMSGYITYTPDEFDSIVGKKFQLPRKYRGDKL